MFKGIWRKEVMQFLRRKYTADPCVHMRESHLERDDEGKFEHDKHSAEYLAKLYALKDIDTLRGNWSKKHQFSYQVSNCVEGDIHAEVHDEIVSRFLTMDSKVAWIQPESHECERTLGSDQIHSVAFRLRKSLYPDEKTLANVNELHSDFTSYKMMHEFIEK